MTNSSYANVGLHYLQFLCLAGVEFEECFLIGGAGVCCTLCRAPNGKFMYGAQGKKRR